jgi:hypothetical protein
MLFNSVNFVVAEVRHDTTKIVSRAHDFRDSQFDQGFAEGVEATLKHFKPGTVVQGVFIRPASPAEVAAELRRRAARADDKAQAVALNELADAAEKQS